MQKPKSKFPLCRLTLSAKAFAMAQQKSPPIAGFCGAVRPDGKLDVAVKASVINLLRQLANPKENLSDTVIRILGAKQ